MMAVMPGHGAAMDILTLHERALDQAGPVVGWGPADQFGTAPPCTEWNVRALLGHLVGGNWRFVAVAEGQPVRRGPEADDRLGDDPAAAYHTSAETLRLAWREPGRLEATYE